MVIDMAPTYTIDQVMACLDALDLEDVYITSVKTKASIRARVAYATNCRAGQKMKGLVVLVPDTTTKNHAKI
jgi:hypothetical protein